MSYSRNAPLFSELYNTQYNVHVTLVQHIWSTDIKLSSNARIQSKQPLKKTSFESKVPQRLIMLQSGDDADGYPQLRNLPFRISYKIDICLHDRHKRSLTSP